MDIYYLCFVTVYYLLLSMIDNKMKAYLANRSTFQVQFVKCNDTSKSTKVDRQEKDDRIKVMHLPGDRISAK